MSKGFTIKNIITFLCALILFSGCSFNKLQKSSSATILIKTPAMKFYDKGFINKYTNYTQVQVFSVGVVVLDMKIYDDIICSSTFECMDLKTFNRTYLHESYKEDFIKKLFDKNEKNVVFRDRNNRVLIKIKRD